MRSADGLVTGVEALVRWTDPRAGTVSPTSLVRVAEQSGLINDIGAWVLERSCLDRGRWLQSSPARPLDLAVNVSARQLMKPDFSPTVAERLARTGMDPTALVLEMTENIFIEDTERAMAVLADLSDLGVRLALDDFGTGYSSLSYLRRLPDRHRQDRPELHRRHRRAARAARSSRRSRTWPMSSGSPSPPREWRRGASATRSAPSAASSAQGYYFARPMPASDIAARLSNGSAGPPNLPILTMS